MSEYGVFISGHDPRERSEVSDRRIHMANGFDPAKRGGLSAADSALLDRRERTLGSPYRLFYESPVHVVRGEGVLLFDDEGSFVITRDCVIKGAPYPVKGWFVYKTNPMATAPERKKTREMIDALDFMVVADDDAPTGYDVDQATGEIQQTERLTDTPSPSVTRQSAPASAEAEEWQPSEAELAEIHAREMAEANADSGTTQAPAGRRTRVQSTME